MKTCRIHTRPESLLRDEGEFRSSEVALCVFEGLGREAEINFR